MLFASALNEFRSEYRRIVTLHHFTNFLLTIAFYVSKVTPTLCDWIFRGRTVCSIDGREHQIFVFLCFVIFWKNRKAATWLHYVSNVFTFTKLANLILFYRSDPRVAIFYGLICIVQVLLLPEPAYDGPERIVYFRGNNLYDELKRSPNVTWLIEFYVSWSPDCRQVTPVFAKLSEKYTLPNLKFGKLDIGRFSEEATRFRVNNHPTSRQLPTFSLFSNGKETRRRPLVNAKGRAVPFIFNEENVIRDFDLNNLYAECKRNMSKTDRKQMEEEKKNL